MYLTNMLNFEILLIKLILLCYFFNYSSQLECNINCTLDPSLNSKFYFNHVINCFAKNFPPPSNTISLPILLNGDSQPFKITYSFTVIDTGT